jgi:putative Mg2+ transporter-C (MgtC) family protein
MAHGVLTGVGFLCGGVIFQQGVSVHGLTTAASLWITSAIGTLFGVGLYGLAILGTVLAVVTLSAARWLDRTMPQKNFTEIAVRSRRETPLDEAELRAVLAEYDLKGMRLNHCLHDGGTVFELAGAFSGKGSLRLTRGGLPAAGRSPGRRVRYPPPEGLSFSPSRPSRRNIVRLD